MHALYSCTRKRRRFIYIYIPQASDCGTRTSARLDFLYGQQNAFPVPGWFDVRCRRQVRRWQCRWRQHASVKTPACVTTSLKSNAPLKRGHLFEVRPPPGIDPNRNQSLSAHPSLFDRQKGGRLKDEPFATDVCRSHCHYSCQSH